MGAIVKCGIVGIFLCALVPLAISSEDYTEEEEMIISVIRQDDTQPESGTEPSAEFYRCNKGEWRIPGQYIVVMREGSHDNHVERTIRRLQVKAAKRGYLIEVMQKYSGAFHGFLVKMSSDVLHTAVHLPHVKYIEEDSSIYAQGLPWNLDRIVQTKHEPGKYAPPNDGSQVAVYLLDTSIQLKHREIEGRVQQTDFNNVPDEDGVRVHRQTSQCDSHGTHIAGVLSGRDSGVARGASVNGVRLLNCQGKGTVSGALAALEYIRASLEAQPLSPLVVLLPFVGGFSRTLNAACRDMVRSGATLIAAAGNYKDDACRYSPASEPEVITVGATNSADQPLDLGTTGTNYGRCVDLFAPGDDIVSASSDCATCFTPKSGSSQAAAHVAGIAAVILNARPNATSVEVLQLLLKHAVKEAINPDSFPLENRHASPNMVAALPTTDSDLTEEDLLCRSVWSEVSGTLASDSAVTRCRQGEELLSCSSYALEGTRAGDRIEERDGERRCVASNSAGGRGVYAIARCCTRGLVQCQLSTSGQPGTKAVCPKPQHQLTGCSVHSESGVLSSDAGRPHHGDQKACPGGEGMRSYASCCHAPNLQCHLKESGPAAHSEQVEVSCEEAWTLTGCSAFSQGSPTHGAYSRGNTCVAPSSGSSGGEGPTAVAICCRLDRKQEPQQQTIDGSHD
ncbi:proprotein convertase subtilisin/kexin type 9 [Engraulis encrasicolus]|uniref:proprotein convertase subtilisin/kexin type 9 n=1 Tax=Engraulis encrasicolus TaxID=184585 RepID=UPI002FD6D8A4